MTIGFTSLIAAVLTAAGADVHFSGEILRVPSNQLTHQTGSAVLVLVGMQNKTNTRLLFGSASGTSDISVLVPGSKLERQVEGGVPGGMITNAIDSESGTFRDWCFAGGHLHALDPGETYYRVVEVEWSQNALSSVAPVEVRVRLAFPRVDLNLECPEYPTNDVYSGEVRLTVVNK